MKTPSSPYIAGLLVATLGLTASAQQAGTASTEEFARRQYDSGLTFLQNKRYGEALKDLQAVVASFATSSVADNALLQIGEYQLDVARDSAATQAAIDKLLKEYPDTDSAPMAHVLAGRLALQQGRGPKDIDTALASFERVPRLFPGSEAVAAAGYYSGEALRLVRRTDEAVERFRRVTMEYPRSPWAARASLGLAYCMVQQDRALRALPDIQWVRQQFPNTPAAAEALDLGTIIYRLYVRPPAAPFGFSGRFVGNERSDYKDVMGVAVDRDGRVMLGHKAGVAIFDKAGAAAGNVNAVDPTSFFIDDKNRIVVVRGGSLIADKGETLPLVVPTREGLPRTLEDIPAAISTATGQRLVSEKEAKSVLRMGPDGRYLGIFASTLASRLAVNSLDDVAMLDRNTKTVAIADRDGKPVGRVATKGTGYELDDPVDIAYDALDQLYVLDRGKGAVLVFGSKNRLVATVTIPEKSPGNFGRGVALGIDRTGRLFIFDERAKRIQVYQ